MRAKKASETITITARIPAAMIEEAKRLAPARLRRSMTRLLQAGLNLLILQRKRVLFGKGMRRIARDPQAMAENRRIMKEFEVCDGDGLEGR